MRGGLSNINTPLDRWGRRSPRGVDNGVKDSGVF